MEASVGGGAYLVNNEEKNLDNQNKPIEDKLKIYYVLLKEVIAS